MQTNTFKGCNVDLKEIKKLMADLEASKLKKLVIKQGDFELHLEKEDAAPTAAMYHPMRQMPVEYASGGGFQEEALQKGERGGARRPEVIEGTFVTSPMVGTFYATPSPDAPAFVKVGDRVSENTVVCIIEAMKVMNEVKANVAGTVAEVLLDSGHPVEFGSKLFRIV